MKSLLYSKIKCKKCNSRGVIFIFLLLLCCSSVKYERQENLRLLKCIEITKQKEICQDVFKLCQELQCIGHEERIMAIIYKESRFNPKARNYNSHNRSWDIGLMQLNTKAIKNASIEDNIKIGILHYKKSLDITPEKTILNYHLGRTGVNNGYTDEKYVSDVLSYEKRLKLQ